MTRDDDYSDLVLRPPEPLLDPEEYGGPTHLALVARYKRLIVDWYVRTYRLGRNDPCMCGSGRKLKKCCGAEA